MKIALIGYGKMGHEVEKIAIARGHEIVFIADSALTDESNLLDAEIAIEFSQPEAAANNLLQCFRMGVPVICGTTGWYNRLEEVKSACRENNGALLYATNFSIGVNIVFHLNKVLARIMQSFDEYEPSLKEVHHIHKKDKPSGTAITLAEGVLSELKRKTDWTIDLDGGPEQLFIEVERTDEVPGTHVVQYDSAIDTIALSHVAKSREGFALGAVKSAEWLLHKKGVFTIHDFLKF